MHQKAHALLRMLKRTPRTLVLVDPRVDGVDVPEDLYDQLPLGIDLGLHLPIPIDDLSVTGDGFSATLSFNRSPYFVTIPWDAVFGMVGSDNQGPLWPDQMPPEVVDMFPLNMVPSDPVEQDDSHLRTMSLGVIDGDKKEPTKDTPTEAPHLRLVK